MSIYANIDATIGLEILWNALLDIVNIYHLMFPVCSDVVIILCLVILSYFYCRWLEVRPVSIKSVVGLRLMFRKIGKSWSSILEKMLNKNLITLMILKLLIVK